MFICIEMTNHTCNTPFLFHINLNWFYTQSESMYIAHHRTKINKLIFACLILNQYVVNRTLASLGVLRMVLAGHTRSCENSARVLSTQARPTGQGCYGLVISPSASRLSIATPATVICSPVTCTAVSTKLMRGPCTPQSEKFLDQGTRTWRGADIWVQWFLHAVSRDFDLGKSWSYIWLNAGLTTKVRV